MSAGNVSPLLMILLAAAGMPTAPPRDDLRLEVEAARPLRTGTPLEAEVGAEALPAGPLVLRDEGGRAVPAQRVPGIPVRLAWRLERPLEAGEKRVYRLESSGEGPGSPGGAECRDVEGKHLICRAAGRDVLRYNQAVVSPPPGVDEVFARSGYIHPVWTPGGRVITNDFPPKHLHHHGIWFPWTSAVFEGRKSDFWNSKERQGRIECVKVEGLFSGPVLAGFRAHHRFLNLNAPDGPRPALDETWEVRVYASPDPFLFDLVSVQSCATASPLLIRKYHYGGLGFRGSGEWEGPDGVAYLTSEGKTRRDGHGTTARWCLMRGTVQGREVSIGFLCHPTNFRFPQGMRIHPDEPFFNWAPCQGGDFQIEPGRPYVSRYRFVVRDGPLEAGEMDRFWSEYAESPRISRR